jgi:opacity protein-like surface antigen
MDLLVNAAYVPSERLRIDATAPESTRVSGPIPLNMVIVDLSIGMTLTGNKTWHGLAPYLSAGIGLVLPTETPVDPGGFKAGSGFTFAGALGMRARVTRNLALQFEARDNTIRYEWPLSYFAPKDNAGNSITPPILNPVGNKETQTTHNFTLSAGLSWNFNF